MRNSDHPPPRRDGVQSIARAAAVLRALGPAPGGLSLGDLAEAVELPKSTVHRLVGALVDEGLLARSPGGDVVLGPELARLAGAARADIAGRLQPVLVALGAELDETVDLAVPDGDVARFIAQVPAPRRLRAVSAVGTAFPMYCTANGKALLAAMDDERVVALLPAALPAFTPATITDRADLLAELAEVRRTGLALDREEHTEGICAVSALVRDAHGPVAAISVPAPTQRFRAAEQRYGAGVLAAARQASRLLAP